MTLSKKGNCGVYAFDVNGAFSRNDETIRFMGWHIGPTGSAEITLHGKLDCYVNGTLVQGNGTIVYKIQPDDTYTGVERNRPHRHSCEQHGLLTAAPSLLTNGSLGLTVVNNAGGKGSLKVAVKGQEDDWEGTPKRRGSTDRDIAKDYDKASKKEYGVDLKDASGSLKIYKMPTVQARMGDQWGGFYPASGDVYDVPFRLAGLQPGDVGADPDAPVVIVAASDLPASGTTVTQIVTPAGGKLVLDTDPAPALSGVWKSLTQSGSGFPTMVSTKVLSFKSTTGVPDNSTVVGGGNTSYSKFAVAKLFTLPPGIVLGAYTWELELQFAAKTGSNNSISAYIGYKQLDDLGDYQVGTMICNPLGTVTLDNHYGAANWELLTEHFIQPAVSSTAVSGAAAALVKIVQTETLTSIYLNGTLISESPAYAGSSGDSFYYAPNTPIWFDVRNYVVQPTANPAPTNLFAEMAVDAVFKYTVVRGA